MGCMGPRMDGYCAWIRWHAECGMGAQACTGVHKYVQYHTGTVQAYCTGTVQAYCTRSVQASCTYSTYAQV